MLRLNPKTGRITTVCPDPLCMHNTPECPFTGRMFNLSIDGNLIIYARRYVDRDNLEAKNEAVIQICSYNLSNMEMKVHRETVTLETNKGAFVKSMMYHDGYIYLYDMLLNEETGSYEQGIIRINTQNNKEEILITPHTNNTTKFLFIYDNRIYFTDIDTIYSVNMDFMDKQIVAKGKFNTDHIYTNGQYIFYGIQQSDGQHQLYRMNLDGSNPIDLKIITNSNWHDVNYKG